MLWFAKWWRRTHLGDERELAMKAALETLERRPAEPADEFLSWAAEQYQPHLPDLLVGIDVSSGQPLRLRVDQLAGVHRWTVGATGSGKSAQLVGEEIQLIWPWNPFGLVHFDAKGESAEWLTDLFIPWVLINWENPKAIGDLLAGMRVINPFDPMGMPPLNILELPEGSNIELHAREVSSLIAESVQVGSDNWGPRMSNVVSYALRAALNIGGLSLLEVRSMLSNPEYLNGLLRHITDPDVKEYFVYRFPSENKEAIRAVISRLDLLLLGDTKRVLCTPGCTDFGELLDAPISIINLGNAPRGAEFLTKWWMQVCVRGLSRAILSRKDTKRPVFCVLDEWWMGVDKDLAEHFERLLTLARHKNVALWLINQLPSQIGSRSSSLLSTVKNSCGIHSVFRQSHEDASAMAYMMPVSPNMRVKKDPDGPAYETRPLRPDEQRRAHTEELSRLQERHFWLYPKILGHQAIRLRAPDVPFKEARDFLRQHRELHVHMLNLTRGRRRGFSVEELDFCIATRRERMQQVMAGVDCSPNPWVTLPTPELVSAAEHRSPSAPKLHTQDSSRSSKLPPKKQNKQTQPILEDKSSAKKQRHKSKKNGSPILG